MEHDYEIPDLPPLRVPVRKSSKENASNQVRYTAPQPQQYSKKQDSTPKMLLKSLKDIHITTTTSSKNKRKKRNSESLQKNTSSSSLKDEYKTDTSKFQRHKSRGEGSYDSHNDSPPPLPYREYLRDPEFASELKDMETSAGYRSEVVGREDDRSQDSDEDVYTPLLPERHYDESDIEGLTMNIPQIPPQIPIPPRSPIPPQSPIRPHSKEIDASVGGGYMTLLKRNDDGMCVLGGNEEEDDYVCCDDKKDMSFITPPDT